MQIKNDRSKAELNDKGQSVIFLVSVGNIVWYTFNFLPVKEASRIFGIVVSQIPN